jgi:hypothetical protein
MNILYITLIDMKYNRKTRKYRKKRTLRRKKSIIRGGNVNISERTYVFIICYRARAGREKRRDQLQKCIKSIIDFFTKHNKKYKIIIVEQNNDLGFNLGRLKNIGFLEGEKLYNFTKLYLHTNVDYYIDTTKDFPKELEDFNGNGVLDIYNKDTDNIRIGGCCCFDSESFKKMNGFPNDCFVYYGDDMIFRYRVDLMSIPYTRNSITNNGLIYEEDTVERDVNFNNEARVAHYKSIPIEKNGLTTCEYTIDGNGEFNDESKHICHILANFTEG